MDITEKTNPMSFSLQKINEFRLSLFYFLYSLVFILVHLALISVLSFFHFLLDHDMGVVENWLTLNGWEVLVVSKLLTVILVVKVFLININDHQYFSQQMLGLSRSPTKKASAVIIFLLIMFVSLLDQFGGGVQSNHILDQLFLSSYFGSIFFYGVDIIFLIIIRNLSSHNSQNSLMNEVLCLCIFFISSKFVLPYIGKYAVFLIAHFALLLYFSYKKNGADIIFYLSFVVAPLSSFLGVDLVWDNSYSIFTYSKELPILGVLLIWSLGLGYCLHETDH